MSQEQYDHEHDRAIESAVDDLTTADPGGPLAIQPSASAGTLERSYAELFAQLPFADTPVVPDPACKAALMAHITARVREVPTVTAQPPLAVIPDLGPRGAPSIPGTPSTNAGDTPARPVARPFARRLWAHSAVPLALAATLAVCLVGVAFLAGRVSEQHELIGALEQRVEVSNALAEQQTELMAEQLRHQQKNLEMITEVARQVYPMRGVAGSTANASLSENPRGVIWVCGRHQRWYLSVQGLQPAPSGSDYTLWFVTDKGRVNGGVIDVSQQHPAELEAQFMPEGTRSFEVTLETGAPKSVPSGSPVLVADRSIAL